MNGGLKKLMCITLITKRKIANREQKSERVSPTKKMTRTRLMKFIIEHF